MSFNKFNQSSSNGFYIYNEEQIAAFVKRFEAHRFHRFRDIVPILQKNLKENLNNFTNEWEQAKKVFKGDMEKYKMALRHKDGHNFPHECHIALIAYTMNTIFPKFNEDCRKACGGGIGFSQIRNLSFFFLLRYVMENQDVSNSPVVTNLKLYRGCTRLLSLPRNFKDSLFGFGQFTSTSTKNSVGKDFGGGGTLFIITNASDYPAKTIRLKQHSVVSGEDEVLLSPFQLYTVDKVDKRSDIGHITVHIKLY